MFKPHESTRILLCRSGFLLLCVLPTLLLLGVIWRVRSPEYIDARREEWVAVLSDKLGLDLSIGSLSYPDWDTALLEQVALIDPETGHQLLKTASVEIMFLEGAWRVKAMHPELAAEALPLFTEILPDRLLRGRAVKMAPLEFAAAQLTVQAAESAQTYTQVSAFVANGQQSRKATLHFQIAGEPASTPLEFVVERRREANQPRSMITLHTSNEAVPLAPLVYLWPWLARFGEKATFAGACAWEFQGDDHRCELAGEFRNVALEQLTQQHLAQHQIIGQADVKIESLRLQNHVVRLAKGTVHSNAGGEVSSSLLAAVGEHLQLTTKQPLPNSAQGRLRFRHLAFHFQLDEQGLNLSGDADPGQPGVIMASAADGPLLVESAQPAVPAVHLIQAFSPPSDVQLPATPETKRWIDWLPPPALLPQEEVTTARRNPNLRLKRNVN